MRPQVVFVTSEMYPFSKTGGLGDVLGALPLTLHRMGIRTAVVTPFYGRLGSAEFGVHLAWSDCHVGYPWNPITADIFQANFHGMPVYFVHRSEFFDRRFYYNDHKGDYFDNAERFIFFNRAVMEFLKRLGPAPYILHAHDWQAALVPSFLHYWRQQDPYWQDTRSVMTIHNLAFQGRFSSRLFEGCGLPPKAWDIDGVEFFGDFNFLKGGIACADKITTVSPSYSREILTEKFGCGLQGVLNARQHKLHGILNGADYSIWNPGNNKFIPCNYGANALKGKRNCKISLINELRLDPALKDKPILGFIGRLRRQKGVDLLIDILPRLMQQDVGVVVLGEGNLEKEARLLAMMEDYPGRLATLVSYTEDLAHRIQAGCDIFLMPSTYEPCGLTQMYALRFGTSPVATAVGGLKDTIIPWPDPQATGFIFEEQTSQAFFEAVLQALSVWRKKPDEWQNMVRRAMHQEFTWERSAEEYIELYRELGMQ